MSILTRSCRTPTPYERRAVWSYAYYSAGHHRRDRKPRIRIINTERGGNPRGDEQ